MRKILIVTAIFAAIMMLSTTVLAEPVAVSVSTSNIEQQLKVLEKDLSSLDLKLKRNRAISSVYLSASNAIKEDREIAKLVSQLGSSANIENKQQIISELINAVASKEEFNELINTIAAIDVKEYKEELSRISNDVNNILQGEVESEEYEIAGCIPMDLFFYDVDDGYSNPADIGFSIPVSGIYTIDGNEYEPCPDIVIPDDLEGWINLLLYSLVRMLFPGGLILDILLFFAVLVGFAGWLIREMIELISP